MIAPSEFAVAAHAANLAFLAIITASMSADAVSPTFVIGTPEQCDAAVSAAEAVVSSAPQRRAS